MVEVVLAQGYILVTNSNLSQPLRPSGNETSIQTPFSLLILTGVPSGTSITGLPFRLAFISAASFCMTTAPVGNKLLRVAVNAINKQQQRINIRKPVTIEGMYLPTEVLNFLRNNTSIIKANVASEQTDHVGALSGRVRAFHHLIKKISGVGRM